MKPLLTEEVSSIQSERRRSSRGHTRHKVSAKKSPYFEHPEGGEDDEDEDESESEYESESEFESKRDSAASCHEKGSDTLKMGSLKPEKKRRRSSTSKTPSSVAKKLKRPGEVFIPIKQPSPGEIEYQAHKIHPNTLEFLKGLLHAPV